MDKIDLEIIDELVKDGRASHREIARAIGVSEGTIRRRLKNMLDDDLIQVRAVTGPLGRKGGHHCIVEIFADPNMIDSVLEDVSRMEEVSYAVSAAGRCSIIIWVDTKDFDAFGQFLTQQLRPTPGIVRTESHIVLSVAKDREGRFG